MKFGPPNTTRHKLPKKRNSHIQEVEIGDRRIFLTIGEYDTGQPGEIFLNVNKEGNVDQSLINCFTRAVSIGLQHGVPLETFVEHFTFTRFEPSGSVRGHENIKFSTSIIDYVFRALGVEYLNRNDLAHIPPKEENNE